MMTLEVERAGHEFEPKARQPAPRSADVCFVTRTPVLEAMTHRRNQGVDVLDGPVHRTGAPGPITSVCFRDPDGKLVELSNSEWG